MNSVRVLSLMPIWALRSDATRVIRFRDCRRSNVVSGAASFGILLYCSRWLVGRRCECDGWMVSYVGSELIFIVT